MDQQLHFCRSSPVQEGFMAKEDRGFASMDRNKQREIASKGGKAAHRKGSAHEWTPEEAQAAGRKGGLAGHRKPSLPAADVTIEL
jgi:general stress protein YciG